MTRNDDLATIAELHIKVIKYTAHVLSLSNRVEELESAVMEHRKSVQSAWNSRFGIVPIQEVHLVLWKILGRTKE